jgi:regulatory protein
MTEPDPLDLAIRALRYRDRSASEIQERLARAGIGDDSRAEALGRLVALGYVDDARFAANRAAMLAARGHSDASIRADLDGRGVDSGLVAESLAALEPEEERARAIIERDGRTVRIARRLAARGFSAESVEAATGNVAAGEADCV